MLLCQTHDLVEGLPAVVTANGITLIVTDMVVGGNKDADRVRCLELSAKVKKCTGNAKTVKFSLDS